MSTRIHRRDWLRTEVLSLLLVFIAVWSTVGPVIACTTVLVGRRATSDGSVLMASSCDGDGMGLIYVMPARTYPPDTKLPMYWNVPRPKTYQEYRANVTQGYDLVGSLPTTRTFRSLMLAGNLESMTTGGLNEHGVSIAIEFLPMRAGLACDKGVVGPNSNHWTTSLIANGLLRARTAREAIRVIGALIDEYGFLYYRAPDAGVALPIADEHETWLMEIFGPGANWTPGSGKPGGVWCAQRVPDGEVGCSANRSRIGEVNLDDADHFLASINIFSLARAGILEAGGAVRVAPGLRWSWKQTKLIARMAGSEPGCACLGTEGDRRSRSGSISVFGETGQTHHSPSTYRRDERRL